MPIAELPNLIPALPEIFLAVTAMILLLVGVFHEAPAIDGPDLVRARMRPARLSAKMGILFLVLTLLLVVTVSGGTMVTFENMFVVDPFSTFTKVLILLASVISILLAQDYMENRGAAQFEFPILVMLATVGMMMMVSANNLISLYVGLELQSLSLYVLASFLRDDLRSTEAGLKYFVLGAVASGMMLYGSSLVYGFTGTTDFSMLAVLFESGIEPSLGLTVGLVLILAGLAFKVSAVPFHMWTPDVYEGAPTPVTAFFSVGPKIAAIALFLRVMVGPFGGLVEDWTQIIVLISMASMVLGGFAGIAQQNIKRMMAYSSIGHVGFALIGLAAGTQSGVQGVLVYMAIYLFMNLGAFACILAMRRGELMVESIYDLAGLSRTHPFMAAMMAIFMFSMAGIPPLAGFFGKLYIFLSAVQSGLYALAIIGLLASVVSAFYYIRIVKIMYFDKEGEALESKIGTPIHAVLIFTGLFTLLFFIVPGPLLDSAAMAAAALF